MTWPPIVGDRTVNGHSLQLPDNGFILESGHAEGHVFVASESVDDRSQSLGRYDLEGRAIWTVPYSGAKQVRVPTHVSNTTTPRNESAELRWFEGDEEVVGEVTCGAEPVGFVPYER